MYAIYRQSDGLILESGFNSKNDALKFAKRYYSHLSNTYWYIEVI